MRRPRDLRQFALGLCFIALALLLLRRDPAFGSVWLVGGPINIIASFFVKPRRPSGPGPLDATGTGRFRGTGWPPSKEPDDYQ